MLAAACSTSAESCPLARVNGFQCSVVGESSGEPTFGCGLAGAAQVLLGAAGCQWRRSSSRLMPLPRKTGSPTWLWPATVAPRGQVPSQHDSRGGDQRGSRLPTPHASLRPHGTRDGCFHHWGATAQSSPGPVPRHQRTNLPLRHPARIELARAGAVPTATQGWRTPLLGGTAELALGGS